MTKRRLLIVVFVLHHAVASSFFADSTSFQSKQLLKAGLAYQNDGKIEQALQSYFSALRLANNTHEGWDAAMVSQRIANLYEQYYRYEESLKYLKTTHRYFQRVDSVLALAKVSNNVAWHFIKLHQMDSALRYAEQSIQSFRRLDNPPTMAYCIALESLGEIYSFKGKDDLAQATLKECLDLGHRTKNEVIVGFANYGLALNEFNHSRYATAKAYISRCVPIADQYATGALLADVYRLAFQIYDSSHQPTVAYRYLKVYQQLRDSLYTQDVEKKAAIVNANYEIQK